MLTTMLTLAPKLRNLYLSRTSWFLCAAGLIALSVHYVPTWAEKRDNPPAQSLQNEGDIVYKRDSIHVVITCQCPFVLTASRARVLPVEIKWHRNTAAVSTISKSPEKIFVLLDAGSATINPSTVLLTDSDQLLSDTGSSQSFPVTIKAPDTAVYGIKFRFEGEGPSSFGSVDWPIAAQSPSMSIIESYAYSLGTFALAASLFWWTDKRLQASRERAEHRLAEAKREADANPERARFAWNLARVKLEAYFDRNLVQVNLVFWVAVFVMTVGFSFVLWGVILSFHQPKFTPTSIVAAVSGIITQFIGATFMVIYRSTMTQANEFMTVLERINSVGMAIQVLDSLPEGTDLKYTTRATIATLLLSRNIHPRAGASLIESGSKTVKKSRLNG
jgi:hypothetical protein